MEGEVPTDGRQEASKHELFEAEFQWESDGTLPPDFMLDAFYEHMYAVRQSEWEAVRPPDERELAWLKERRQFPPETDLDTILGRIASTSQQADELRIQIDETKECLEGLARRAAVLGAAWPAIAKAAGVSPSVARRRWGR